MAEVFVNISIPRWIVEERPDATNVNNWHWTEKNADAWSKAKIKVKQDNPTVSAVEACLFVSSGVV